MGVRAKPQKPPRPPENQPRRARDSGLGQAELARLLGVTPETIRNWTLSGCPRLDSGNYVVAEVFTWVRKIDRERAAKEKAPKEQTEMNRKLAVEADLKELELARERGEVVPVEDFDEALNRVVGGLSAVAAGRLQRFERKIVQTTTAPAARVLAKEIHAALMDAAREMADQLDEDAIAFDAVEAKKPKKGKT